LSPALPNRRVPQAVFALVSYAAFITTSAYGVAFVGNYWAVLGWHAEWLRSLDSGKSAPLAEAVIVDLALIALFAVQHSAMARRGFKAWWTRFVPPEIERSVYVLASSSCLALLFAAWRPIGFVLFDVSKSPLGFVLMGVSLTGWLFSARATFLIDHAELFGLRRARVSAEIERSAGGEFMTPGLYRAVRHPIYLGFLVAFWASPVMTVGHALFAGVLTVYVLFAIRLEERDLMERFGERYGEYRKRVRALLPFPR
jgi:methanethiol S-methyltransferase